MREREMCVGGRSRVDKGQPPALQETGGRRPVAPFLRGPREPFALLWELVVSWGSIRGRWPPALTASARALRLSGLILAPTRAAEAAAGTQGRLSGPARPLRGTRRHESLLNTNPVEAGSMERRRGMVKNDGTADSKERRQDNGNGWRGVGRLGRAGKRAAGRREGDVAGCFTRR